MPPIIRINQLMVKSTVFQETFMKDKDSWLSHPMPDMSEPEKAVCYLTDF